MDKNVVIEKLAFVITTHSLHSLFVCQKELCNDAISNMEKERKSLLEVTKAQREAILHDKGPMMVLAGPGSGKTFVITNRTKALIEEYGVNPREILVITFTKAAATEMKTRFLQMMGQEYAYVNFGTFHAVFFTILKYAYNFTASNILREEDKLRWFTETIRKLQLEIEDEKEFVSSIISEISLVKSERMNVEHYYSINCAEDVFIKIYKSYDEYLRSKNLIDFDDMLLLCYELLTKRSDILKLWQEKFKYILIDEFQDINQVQYDIIRLLAMPQNNLFIVGDDDQSIYRFRGAKPEIMLNFMKDYKDAEQVLLDKNFRSTKNIVVGAQQVVRNNNNRFDKEISAVKESGEPIKVTTFKTLAEENTQVVNQILLLKKEGIPLRDMAILYRTNTCARGLIDKCMEFNIPFRMKDSIPNLFEHWIARDIIAYINIAMGNNDRNLYLQIINRPKRYITREVFRDQTISIADLYEYYREKSWIVDRLEKLSYDLTMLRKMEPYAAVTYIRTSIGYDEYLEDYAKYRRIKVEELYETIDELQESARNFKTYEEWFRHMEEYKEELKEQSQMMQKQNVDGVSFATMHSAKGLEYEVVFMIDCNEGITPHRKAVLDEDIEEERRMFYVAMTRAKSKLFIYSVKERYNKEMSRSRFVGELLFNKQELKPGIRVEHKAYGPGKVTSIEDGKITVYLDKLKKNRVLDLNFCIQNEILRIVPEV